MGKKDSIGNHKLLEDLKLMLTTQILLVLIVDFLGKLPESGLDTLDSINYMLPISFLLFSIVVINRKDVKLEKIFIYDSTALYFIAFGLLILSLYSNLHGIFPVLTGFVYLTSLAIVYFFPIVFFIQILLQKGIK